MTRRRFRKDATVETVRDEVRKMLDITDRYDVQIVDTWNGDRKVRKDAQVETLREKDNGDR